MLLICGCPAHHYRRRLRQAATSNTPSLPLSLSLSLSPSLPAVCQVECVGLAGFVLIPSSFCVAKITMESRVEREKKGTSRRFGPPAAYVQFSQQLPPFFFHSPSLSLSLCVCVCVTAPSIERCQIFLLLPFSTPFWPATNRFDLHNSAHNSTHSFFFFLP